MIIDKSKPYGEITPHHHGALYEQGGLYYNAKGEFMPGHPDNQGKAPKVTTFPKDIPKEERGKQEDIDALCRETNKKAEKELGEGVEFDDSFYLILYEKTYRRDWELFLMDLKRAGRGEPHVFDVSNGDIENHIANVKRLMEKENS